MTTARDPTEATRLVAIVHSESMEDDDVDTGALADLLEAAAAEIERLRASAMIGGRVSVIHQRSARAAGEALVVVTAERDRLRAEIEDARRLVGDGLAALKSRGAEVTRMRPVDAESRLEGACAARVAAVAAYRASAAPPAPVTITCSTCDDTHMMALGENTVMCTRCPTPCAPCAGASGTGAYCKTTPCACHCHAGKP